MMKMIFNVKYRFLVLILLGVLTLLGIGYKLVADARSNYDKYDVVLVRLSGTRGSEIYKTRPCLIISPEDVQDNGNLLIVAPMTSKIKDIPYSVRTNFNNRDGMVLLGQIRTVDKSRIVKKLGHADEETKNKVDLELDKLFSHVA